MDMASATLWATLGAVMSAIFAGIGLLVLKIQVKQAKENISTAILREHEKQFFYSDDISKIRADACRFLKGQLSAELSELGGNLSNNRQPNWLERAVQEKRKIGVQLSPDGWEIVDFLDSLAIYGDQGTIDVEMAFAKFFFFYNRYWYLLKPWIDHFRRLDGNVDYYRDIELFWDEMVHYGAKQRGLILGAPLYSPKDILAFMNEEISGAPNSP